MVRRRSSAGFTLIELMIVIAIIAVLATIAGTAYRRYMDSGRTAEAMAMLGEIRAKEEAYRAEFSAYAGWPTGSEAPISSLPAVDNTTCVGGGTKEPCHKAIPTTFTGTWLIWKGLGINPGRNDLYCGYIVNAGLPGSTVSGTIGQGLLGTAAQTQPWWYAVAICDNDGVATDYATFATASTTSAVSSQNEHK